MTLKLAIKALSAAAIVTVRLAQAALLAIAFVLIALGGGIVLLVQLGEREIIPGLNCEEERKPCDS